MSSSAPIDQWIDEFYTEIFGFICSRVFTQEEARDVAQEVFLAAHKNAHQLESTEKARGWLYRIARNKILDGHRRKQLPISDTSDVSKIAEAVEQNPVEDSAVAHCLTHILSSLPNKYAEAIQLIDVEEIAFSKAAEAIGISVPGLKSRAQRGRKMMREMLQECCEMEFDAQGNIADSEHKVHSCRFCTLDNSNGACH